jgi:2-polyprenyl-3-methyl-5-hydroxy-6-metoxy-1,4-benzoquinol methylase
MKKETNSSVQKRPSSENLAEYQAKYHDSSLIVRYANKRFFHTIKTFVDLISPNKILDVGCGEGKVLEQLGTDNHVPSLGIDLDPARIYLAKSQTGETPFVIGNAQELPLEDNAFDLVMLLEVLEHVGEPDFVLREAYRVTNKYLLASVPNEPWWRIGNLARLKYVRDLGNTPEHINHWSVRGFRKFISKSFTIIKIETPVLWTFILAKK